MTKGKIDILFAWSHISGLPNGRNLTEHGRNGGEGKEVQVDGPNVRTNFVVAHRLVPTFTMAYR
jgi:hypothetical protein